MSSEQIKFLENDKIQHDIEGCLYYANHKGLIKWINPKTKETGYYFSDGLGDLKTIVKIEPTEITKNPDKTLTITNSKIVIDKDIIITILKEV